MTSLVDLLGCNIVERDSNGDVLWTWTYPSITPTQQSLILRKCGLDSDQINLQPFIYGRLGKSWYYISCTEVFDSDNLRNVKQFALIIWAKDFSPEKYETLCRILSKTYCKTGNPAVMLQLYLSVVTRGSCTTEENGTFLTRDFETWKNTPPNTVLKELIKTFGLESILIYTALLLKKRIIVYHHSFEALLKWVRTFPVFVWHRKNHDFLFPCVDLLQEELVNLKSSTWYVAGCRDNSIATRSDLYDVLVNLPAREIIVAQHAKESMVMTKVHKDIAVFMVQLAQNDDVTENQLVREIAEKTKELLNQLRSLAVAVTPDGKRMVTLEALKEKNLPPALDNFLFNLAVAENIMML